MTTKQENKFSMFIQVRDYLSPQNAITAAIPNFLLYFTPFQNNITQIQGFRDVQEGDKTGVALTKKQLRDSLTATAMDVGRKLVAFASVTGNATLEVEVTYTESDMKKSPDTIFKDITQLLYNRANANVGSLTSYGITATTQTAFLASINNFQAAIPKPKLTLNDRKTATENIQKVFDLNDGLLTKMDKLVAVVQTSQANFYAGYDKARKVVELGSSSLALKSLVVDSLGAKLPNVHATITSASATSRSIGDSEKPIVVKKTTAKGGFQHKHLAEGSYIVTLVKPGFKTETKEITVVKGEMTRLRVVMERL